MLKNYWNIFYTAGLVLCVFEFLFLKNGFAAIGDSLSAVSKDLPEATSSSPFVLPGGVLNGFQLNSPNLVIREYAVSPSSPVVCVTWSGVVSPSMRLLLGQYYSEYRTDLQFEFPHSLSRRTDNDGSLSVVHGGHMGHLVGSACLTKELPPGISQGELP